MATKERVSELLPKDSVWASCAHFNSYLALNYRYMYRNFFNYMATPLHPLRHKGCKGVPCHKMHVPTRHKMHVDNNSVGILPTAGPSQDARALTCRNTHLATHILREYSPQICPSQDARGQLCSSTESTPPINLPAVAARLFG